MRTKADREREADQTAAAWMWNIWHFYSAVRHSFAFLETEYGYERRGTEIRGFDDFRDANVASAYFSLRVALEISLWLCDSQLGVALYELVDGRIPTQVSVWGHAGYARAIDGDAYIEMASGQALPPVLTQASPRKPRIGEIRAAELRREQLRTNMSGVVAQEADKVKTWCPAILKGDTSMFPAVQKLYREKYWPKGFPIEVSDESS